VPYRQCALTKVLSDSLGGQAKCLLIAAIPGAQCTAELAVRAAASEEGEGKRDAWVVAPPRAQSCMATLSSAQVWAPRIALALTGRILGTLLRGVLALLVPDEVHRAGRSGGGRCSVSRREQSSVRLCPTELSHWTERGAVQRRTGVREGAQAEEAREQLGTRSTLFGERSATCLASQRRPPCRRHPCPHARVGSSLAPAHVSGAREAPQVKAFEGLEAGLRTLVQMDSPGAGWAVEFRCKQVLGEMQRAIRDRDRRIGLLEDSTQDMTARLSAFTSNRER